MLYNTPNMHRPKNRKQEILRRTLVYGLMTMIVTLLVTILLFIVMGYQYDEESGRIEQGGLLQLASKPTGAKVSIDGNEISGRTDTKYYALAGEHDVKLELDGYKTWTKHVRLGAGSILWLNYARMVPQQIATETVAGYNRLDSSLASPNKRYIMLSTNAANPNFEVINLTGDRPVSLPLVLPEGSFTRSADGRYDIIEWDKTSRYVLVRHDYSGKSEFILVDTQDVGRSKNIRNEMSLDARKVKFAFDGGLRIYATTVDNTLVSDDLGDGNLPTIVGTKIADFSINHESYITFTSLADVSTGKYSVGYYRSGSNTQNIVASSSSARSRIAIAHYFNADYMVFYDGNSLRISQIRSDIGIPEASLSMIATLPNVGDIDDLDFGPNGRFVVASSAANDVVYDLELKQYTDIAIAESGSAPTWLDEYYLTSVKDGKLFIFEFDGQNKHEISAGIAGQAAVVSANNSYVYTFASKGSQVIFTRSRLTI